MTDLNNVLTWTREQLEVVVDAHRREFFVECERLGMDEDEAHHCLQDFEAEILIEAGLLSE
jgi:hypothetical protein